MARNRHDLARLLDGTLLTDGGLETTLIFHVGIDLPCMAAFPLIETELGQETLRRYFRPYLTTARARRTGFILDTPTWRANPDWGARLGYDPDGLARICQDSVMFCAGLREAYETRTTPIVINGVVGPRGDGYRVDQRMSAEEAEHYHAPQVAAFRSAQADMVSAVTMTYAEEAVGIARAARAQAIPSAISFTVETDGRLPSGETLRSAIERVDQATGAAPAYYMINCAHPLHFAGVLSGGEPWVERIRGLRANASTMSHEELDNATQLDPGDPEDLARRYRELRGRFGHLTVLGGCCGTDHRHVAAICDACLPDELAAGPGGGARQVRSAGTDRRLARAT